MSNKVTYALIAILLGMFWYGVIGLVWFFAEPTTRRVDCSMSSFHPDFTPAMRKQCRKETA